jgi:hypothetical protein
MNIQTQVCVTLRTRQIGWALSALLGACLWQPLTAQAQVGQPTTLLEAIAGKRPVATGPVIKPRGAMSRTHARSQTDANEEDPDDLIEDPDDLIPDDPPEQPLEGDNEPVVAENEGEALELDNVGPIDGIYQCSYEFANRTMQTYVSVNGKGNGQSIFLIANMAENSLAMSGWGIGQVVDVDGLGYAFIGETNNQLPFELAVVVDDQGQAVAEGTVGFDAKGTKMLVDISCSSIW